MKVNKSMSEKKIKVLRIINRFNLGGPTYNATFLSAFLPEEYNTKLIGGKHEDYEGGSLFIPQKYGLNPEIVDELQREIDFKSDRAAYQKIREIIREFQPDIVHTHASKSGAIGRLAAFKENVPVVVHTFHGHVFHSYFGKVKTGIYKTIERYLAKKSSAVIAISDIQKNELVEIHQVVPKNKVRVINLGFDLSKFQTDLPQKRKQFSEEYQIKEDEICVGIIGRLTDIKNHDLFFKMADLVLKQSHQKLRFFIIGDGELMGELKLKAKQISDQINKHPFVFTSWIKDVDVPLARLDVVCLTSFNEGTPVSLIEAQAANVPVISTNVGGVKDIVNVNETAYVIDDFEPSSFAEKLLLLTDNKDIRQKMSQNGWNYVEQKFHYNTLCSHVDKLYKELLKNYEESQSK